MSLFFNLPTQHAPARDAKQANARHRAAIAALGLETDPTRRPHYVAPSDPVAVEFIGPLDLRPIMVRRWSTGDKFNGRKLSGRVEGASYFTSKTARALRLGEATREMTGTVDPTQIGIGGKK